MNTRPLSRRSVHSASLTRGKARRERVKVALCANPGTEPGGIEESDRPRGAAPSGERLPKRLPADPARRHHPDTGDDGTPLHQDPPTAGLGAAGLGSGSVSTCPSSGRGASGER